jgi:glycerophosphoryl diester phosphodiesterase
MKIISHRGGSSLAPENSLEAIKISKSLGVGSAEIDVRLTKDAKLVVFHDKNLKRLAGINKLVENLTLEEIKKIKLKSGYIIPTLEEVIETAGDLPLVIEGKGKNWADILSKTIENYKNIGKLRVISFNAKELFKFKQFRNDIKCYVCVSLNGFKAVSTARVFGFEGIDIHFLAHNPIVHLLAKYNRQKVIVYTPNSYIYVRFINLIYPSVEITTDNPDKFMHLVKQIND